MKLSADLRSFCQKLGHEFAEPELLIRALTHSSLSSPTRRDNQRLEFLGDRVLGLTIAEALLDADPDAEEGTLAPRFNALVRKETCADIARSIELGAVLKIGKSEMATGGRRKEALLGDAMEAVIGAVHCDAGFEAARALVLRLWTDRVVTVEADARDAKTALQELLQGRGEVPPRYSVIDRSGPDHQPLFTVEVATQSGQSSQARAGSKRHAEQAAAAQLLERLQDG